MNKEEISDRKVETRLRKNGRKDKVIIEKSAAQGLPEGWVKKLVITNRSCRKIRRDPFFIDPKSCYIFQSFKDASRYVETGNIGIYARKLKETDVSGTVLPLESVGKRSADDLLEKEEKNCELDSSLCNVTSQVHKDMGNKAKDPMENLAKRVTRSQAKANMNKEEHDSKRKNMSSSNAKSEKYIVKSGLSNASSQNPEKESIMKKDEAEDSRETRIRRSKLKVEKNEVSNGVVRRASKRLAGIELEPTPELKTKTKAQRVGTASECKQPVNPVATGLLKKTDIPVNKEVAKSYDEHSSRKPNAVVTTNNCVSAEMEVHIEKMSKPGGKKAPVISEAKLNPVFHLDGYKPKEEMSTTKCEKTGAGKRSPKCKGGSAKASEGSSSIGELHLCDNGNAIHNLGSDSSKLSVVRGKVVEKNSSRLPAFDSTLVEMWKDPCIAFAIKTLTGETVHVPSTTAISCEAQKNESEQKGVGFIPETDIWKDPCIDFAIKTLTGAIPIGFDESIVKSRQ